MKQITIPIITLMLLNGLMAFANAPEKIENDYWDLNKANSFFGPECPLMDGVIMFMLRTKFTLDGYQTIINSGWKIDEQGAVDHDKIMVETYLPILECGPVKSLFGIRYSKTDLYIDDQYNYQKELEYLFAWNAWRFSIGNKLQAYLTVDSLFLGDQISKLGPLGTNIFSFASLLYAISPHWMILAAGGVDFKILAESNKVSPIIGAQLRWQPNDKFKIIIGLPVLAAMELSIFDWLDLGANLHYSMNHGAFIRIKVNELQSLSLIYEANGYKSENSYFPGGDLINLESLEQSGRFNNLCQKQYRMSIEYGLTVYNNTAISLGLGYAIGGDLEAKYDEQHQATLQGENFMHFYIRVNNLSLE